MRPHVSLHLFKELWKSDKMQVMLFRYEFNKFNNVIIIMIMQIKS